MSAEAKTASCKISVGKAGKTGSHSDLSYTNVCQEQLQETTVPLYYKAKANKMSQTCNKWVNRFFAQASSCCIPTNSCSLVFSWWRSPGVRTATPIKWTECCHRGHGRFTRRLTRTSARTALETLINFVLTDTYVSKTTKASVWKEWTPLWDRQWEWHSWETGREKRKTEKAFEACLVQTYSHGLL